MKKTSTFVLMICLSQYLMAQTTLFVNDNATGSNNGSSWANAYTSLDAALAAAVTGNQVWVAAGTYKPSNVAPNNSFIIKTGISLYGSFAGTETAVSQRNIATNLSVLHGDILGDDVLGNFDMNRSDNAIHVVRTTLGSSTDRATVDGFVISGGTTLIGTNDAAAMKRGAGISVEAKSTINNCTFSDNRADSGSGIYAGGAAVVGLIVSNCLFEKNDVNGRASGIYLLNVTGAEVKNCVFRDNKTVRGCLYPRTSTNISISGCLFQNNTNKITDGFGAGIFSLETTYSVTNCQFIGNKAASGAAFYLENQVGGNVVTIKKCLFEENIATGYGGTGMYVFDGTYTADSCTFRKNVAPSSGAAIYNGGASSFTVSNSLIEGSTGSYAAAVANYGEGTVGTFDRCLFQDNIATNGGGACSNGFRANVLYKDCSFINNKASFGGAIFTQNDTTALRVDGCLFSGNAAEGNGNGGAIFKNDNVSARIKNSTFSDNVSDSGAGIFARGDSILLVENTRFVNNVGLVQGVAVNLSNTVNAVFINTLMAANNNYNTDMGAGGALINNASGGETSTVKMINCTIADNFSPIGSGLAQWEDDSSNAVLILQNCLIQNTIGENYIIEAGQPEVISQGGNQSSDYNLQAYFTAPKDLNNTVNNFVDAGTFNYHLLLGIAVDGGVAAGAPTTDLEGNTRVGLPDVGAYEFLTVGTSLINILTFPMQAAPNPVIDRTLLSLDNAWMGAATLELIGANGAILRAIQVEKTTQKWQYEWSLSDLPAGAYWVQLRGTDRMFRVVLVKGR